MCAARTLRRWRHVWLVCATLTRYDWVLRRKMAAPRLLTWRAYPCLGCNCRDWWVSVCVKGPRQTSQTCLDSRSHRLLPVGLARADLARADLAIHRRCLYRSYHRNVKDKRRLLWTLTAQNFTCYITARIGEVVL